MNSGPISISGPFSKVEDRAEHRNLRGELGGPGEKWSVRGSEEAVEEGGDGFFVLPGEKVEDAENYFVIAAPKIENGGKGSSLFGAEDRRWKGFFEDGRVFLEDWGILRSSAPTDR